MKYDIRKEFKLLAKEYKLDLTVNDIGVYESGRTAELWTFFREGANIILECKK